MDEQRVFVDEVVVEQRFAGPSPGLHHPSKDTNVVT